MAIAASCAIFHGALTGYVAAQDAAVVAVRDQLAESERAPFDPLRTR